MTIPNLPIPDTRPGYAFQTPGVGGEIAGGLGEVIKALLAGQRIGSERSQLALHQQQVNQVGEYQRALIADAQARMQAARDAALAQQIGDTEVGRAIQQIGQPGTVQTPLPTTRGISLPLPVGAAQTPEQVIQGLRPDLIPQFYAQGAPAIQAARKAGTEAEQAKARAAFVANLPSGLRSYGQLIVQTHNAGLSPEAANKLFGDQLDQVPESTVRAISKQHPEWAKLDLPPKELVKLAVDYEVQRNQAIFRPPEKGEALKPVPPGVIGAVKTNQAALDAIDQAIADLQANPKSISWINRIPGMTVVRNQLEPTERVLARGAVVRSKFLTIYDQTGKQVNMVELKNRGDLPDVTDRPDVAIGKLQRLRQVTQQGIDFFRQQYSPEQRFRGIVPAPMNADSLRSKMRSITGEFRP